MPQTDQPLVERRGRPCGLEARGQVLDGLLSVTLFDDGGVIVFDDGFGGVVGTVTWWSSAVTAEIVGDCRGRHADGGFWACGSTPARVLRCAGVGAGAGRG